MLRAVIFLTSITICLALTENRISGGTATTIESRPFQLVVLWSATPFCSAAIISEYWAITSGLCANGPGKKQPMPEITRLKAGSGDWQDGGTIHQVIAVVVHENFNTQYLMTPDYDLALLKVEEPFVFGPTVQPVPLAEVFPEFEDEMVVSGWGSTTFRQARVQVVESRDCAEAYTSFPFDAKITDRMICSEGFADFGDGPCSWDDLGSVLTANDKLIGIVSNPTCGYEDQPSVYANTVILRDWIREQTGV